MTVLSSSHPKIKEFINCKNINPQKLSSFNISVKPWRFPPLVIYDLTIADLWSVIYDLTIADLWSVAIENEKDLETLLPLVSESAWLTLRFSIFRKC